MATPYTASSNLASTKLKAFVSTSTSLSDADLLSLLNDSLRSYVVPFVKKARDEWFVKGGSTLYPGSNGRITIPNGVAGTIRTISWNNNGILLPLTRIEPENALPLLNSGGAQPIGYTLRGYEIQIVPSGVGHTPIYIEFMQRPSTMVLEQDAGKVTVVAGPVLTLSSVPLAWQTAAPTSVDVISQNSPFSPVVESVGVTSLVGSVLVDATISSFSALKFSSWPGLTASSMSQETCLSM
jgi:hypothetical protein